jgi:uncharacterized protein YggE
MSKRAWAAGAAALAVALAAVLVNVSLGQAASPPSGAPHTITVSSTATISTAPDEAVITFGVHTDGSDPVAALNESSRIMNAVLSAMKALDITERDMETTNVSVAPQTINRGTANETTIYNSSTTLEVTLHDFDSIGAAIQDGVKAGATSVRGVRFQVSDPAGAKKHALEAAVKSARAKADALAGAAGASVTGVVQIHEDGPGGNPRPYYANERSLVYDQVAAGLSVVAPHNIETKVSISVIWNIG